MSIQDTTLLKRYLCHKVVYAAPILSSDVALDQMTIEMPDGSHQVRDIPPHARAGKPPSRDDYYVVYTDGYASISPKSAFEAGYTEVLP